jgi:hypothetical protein
MLATALLQQKSAKGDQAWMLIGSHLWAIRRMFCHADAACVVAPYLENYLGNVSGASSRCMAYMASSCGLVLIQFDDEWK